MPLHFVLSINNFPFISLLIFYVMQVISAMVGAFIGLVLGILILAIFAAISLWLYGSFWTTSLIIFIGGYFSYLLLELDGILSGMLAVD